MNNPDHFSGIRDEKIPIWGLEWKKLGAGIRDKHTGSAILAICKLHFFYHDVFLLYAVF
jgi:hypothetical protein